jgi:hypothetical protein
VASALVDSVDRDRGVRLLGVSLSGLGDPAGGSQLRFDLHLDGGASPGGGPAGAETGQADPLVAAREDAERLQGSWASVSAAVDAIRARYGGESVGPASLVGDGGVRVRHRGDAAWGPTGPGPGQSGACEPGTL